MSAENPSSGKALSKIKVEPKDEQASKGELVDDEYLLKEFLEIERQRIASADKKADNAKLLIETSDASDKRQFDYHMKKLECDDAHRKQRHELARSVITKIIYSSFIILLVLFGFMFLGNEKQSELASSAMQVLFIGGAGYGIVSGLITFAKKLLNTHSPN